jgi:hypothetical protein
MPSSTRMMWLNSRHQGRWMAPMQRNSHCQQNILPCALAMRWPSRTRVVHVLSLAHLSMPQFDVYITELKSRSLSSSRPATALAVSHHRDDEYDTSLHDRYAACTSSMVRHDMRRFDTLGGTRPCACPASMLCGMCRRHCLYVSDDALLDRRHSRMMPKAPRVSQTRRIQCSHAATAVLECAQVASPASC